jgi:hypothetical protein
MIGLPRSPYVSTLSGTSRQDVQALEGGPAFTLVFMLLHLPVDLSTSCSTAYISSRPSGLCQPYVNCMGDVRTRRRVHMLSVDAQGAAGYMQDGASACWTRTTQAWTKQPMCACGMGLPECPIRKATRPQLRYLWWYVTVILGCLQYNG